MGILVLITLILNCLSNVWNVYGLRKEAALSEGISDYLLKYFCCYYFMNWEGSATSVGQFCFQTSSICSICIFPFLYNDGKWKCIDWYWLNWWKIKIDLTTHRPLHDVTVLSEQKGSLRSCITMYAADSASRLPPKPAPVQLELERL